LINEEDASPERLPTQLTGKTSDTSEQEKEVEERNTFTGYGLVHDDNTIKD
jgi:hypothetical protein